MIEKEQLGALYAVALEQQAASGAAVQALQQQASAINTAVKALGQAAALVSNLPAQVTASSATWPQNLSCPWRSATGRIGAWRKRASPRWGEVFDFSPAGL